MNIPIAVVCIVAALVLYSVAILSERRAGRLAGWMIGTFVAAFVCDLTGTVIMWFRVTGTTYTLHELCGYAALGIMLAHLSWALISLRWAKAAHWFHRYSLYAWLVWLVAFMTGIPRAS